MKRIFMAAAALAALSVAGTAVASTHAVTTTFTVNGRAPAQCHLHADRHTVNLHHDALVDHDGFVKHDVSSEVAHALTDADVHAWCTGNHNSINLSRTALHNEQDGGLGVRDAQGFDNAIIYDLLVRIDGAVRNDSSGVDLDGTEDGIGNGPSDVSDFGPTGHGARVRFFDDHTYTTLSPQSEAVDSDANSLVSDQGPDSNFNTSHTRVAAGDYTGTVTLTITPGV